MGILRFGSIQTRLSTQERHCRQDPGGFLALPSPSEANLEAFEALSFIAQRFLRQPVACTAQPRAVLSRPLKQDDAVSGR